MLDCNIFPGLSRDYLEAEVNLFLLPMMENDGEDALTRAGQKRFVVLCCIISRNKPKETFFMCHNQKCSRK